MLCLFVFFVGLLGNLISQSARGLLGIFFHLTLLVPQILRFCLSLAQFVGGGREESSKTFRRALVSSRACILGILKGLTRLFGAFTLITPVMRGAQSVSEPFGISGIYAPSGCETWMQELIGLDSWRRMPKEMVFVERSKNVSVVGNVKTCTAAVKTCTPVLEGLILAYREATALKRPEYWILRGSDTRGPYSLERVLRGFREGKLNDSDMIASSLSNEWQDWANFKNTAMTIASFRRKAPRDIIKSIAIRYPKFYMDRIKGIGG